jgi:hypothetical protein
MANSQRKQPDSGQGAAVRSKNKPAPTAAERAHIERLKETPCPVCDDPGEDIHEPEQGYWFISLHLCKQCHTGPHGWHGDRLRWKLHKMDELKAINKQLGMLS